MDTISTINIHIAASTRLSVSIHNAVTSLSVQRECGCIMAKFIPTPNYYMLEAGENQINTSSAGSSVSALEVLLCITYSAI